MNYYPAYTLDKVLNMYAVSFYSLVSAMYRLKGKENYELAIISAVGNNGGDGLNSYLENSKKQSLGAEALLRETRVLKEIKRNKK